MKCATLPAKVRSESKRKCLHSIEKRRSPGGDVEPVAREPQFTFSSQPDLPQDEVLSRILFSKASGGLSAIQALQLAQVAWEY